MGNLLGAVQCTRATGHIPIKSATRMSLEINIRLGSLRRLLEIQAAKSGEGLVAEAAIDHPLGHGVEAPEAPSHSTTT